MCHTGGLLKWHTHGMNTCECGCGKAVNLKSPGVPNHFIKGHYNRGRRWHKEGVIPCGKCGELRQRGSGNHCKPCSNKRLREARAKDNSARRASELKYKRSEKGRAQIQLDNQRAHRRRTGAIGNHTRSEWEAIKAKQKGFCAAFLDGSSSQQCHSLDRLRCRLQVDHIVALARGGTNYAFNLQGLCGPCNQTKNDKLTPGTQHSLFDGFANPKRRQCPPKLICKHGHVKQAYKKCLKCKPLHQSWVKERRREDSAALKSRRKTEILDLETSLARLESESVLPGVAASSRQSSQ